MVGWQNSVQEHNYEAIKADYLTGNFSVEQLVEKHGVRQQSVLWYVRNRWKKMLIASGKTPPPDPKLTFKVRPPALWKDIELQYRHGASVKELASKYDIHPMTIAQKMSREGWVVGKRALPGWGARSICSPEDFGIRMENFAMAVRTHVERVLVVLEKYRRAYHSAVSVQEIERVAAAMNIISKSFAAIVETGFKLYKFTAISREAEESVYEESVKARSKKAIEEGMKAPIKPNKMAVPIRIEKPDGAVIEFNNVKRNGAHPPVMEHGSDAGPGPTERPEG